MSDPERSTVSSSQLKAASRWGLRIAAIVVLAPLLAAAVPGQAGSPPGSPAATPETVIRELYDLVTFEAGSMPDWEAVKALFIEEAVIVLRTSPEGTTTFSRQGFVDDFTRFAEREDVQQAGFQEKIIQLHPWVFGDMAHVLVLYKAHIPGSARDPRQGVDTFLLIRKQGEWRIVAVTNEVTTPERPLPPPLR